MKVDNTKYFEEFNLLIDRIKGQRIEKILCCLIEDQKPEDYRFGSIQGADFGFDFVIDSGETFNIRVNQIGYSFGLHCGFDTIKNNINDGPKLWDLTSQDFVSQIINKPIIEIEYKKVQNVAGRNFKDKIEFIDQVEILTEEDSFMVLAAEYLPDKDSLYLEADEATLIVGQSTLKKYKLKNATQQGV